MFQELIREPRFLAPHSANPTWATVKLILTEHHSDCPLNLPN